MVKSKHIQEARRSARSAPQWSWALLLLVAMVALSVIIVDRVVASVTLKSFKATRLSDGSISVDWETATETGTSLFRVYRSLSADTVGQPVATRGAEGDSVTGHAYNYTDPASELIAGRNYYYRLEEVNTAGGSSWHGPVNPGGTSATSTRSLYGTPTSTDPPTATRRFTNTPAPPTPLPPTQVVPQQPVAPQPVAPRTGPGVVTTPTGLPAIAPVPLPATATVEIPTPTSIPSPTGTPTSTPTNTPRPTPTPTPTSAPEVFVARSDDGIPSPTAILPETPQLAAASPDEVTEDGLPVGLLIGGALIVGTAIGFLALGLRRAKRS
jgi:hypothetical protein